MNITDIFDRIHELTHEEGHRIFLSVLLNNNEESVIEKQDTEQDSEYRFLLLNKFRRDILDEIDSIARELKNDSTILISVKNQKLLRSCFQLVTTLGVSFCLIPGLGISLYKRCSSANLLPSVSISDEQKYDILAETTDFFTRSYEIPVLKNIIITFHLSDYLAALIQLSFAPLKKPGTYNNFIMTPELYEKLDIDRKKYVKVYECLVNNCFQPILMKELLILQSATEPSPPAFVKRIISKEMSDRLLKPGGLLSLTRCFIESYDIDTGFEWKKINVICKIITIKHGNIMENDYLNNISNQLQQMLTSNNSRYLATAVSCVLCLNENYPQSEPVQTLMKNIFQSFDFDYLIRSSKLPGTVILSSQEVEHTLNILHACLYTCKIECPIQLIFSNIHVLFLLGMKCTKNQDLIIKIREVLLKSLELLSKDKMLYTFKNFLFGRENPYTFDILVEEFNAGLTIKCIATQVEYPKHEAITYFLDLFKGSTAQEFAQNIFECSLELLIDFHSRRQTKPNPEILFEEDDSVILGDTDEQYAVILQLLSEISTLPKVITAIKNNPTIVLTFIEYFILKIQANSDEECVTIALMLLNTILSNSNNIEQLKIRLDNLIPILQNISKDNNNFNNILCNEALSLMSTKPTCHTTAESSCKRAISDVFDSLLPVRAHGVIQLTKLIDAKDPETISKKHYIFCIFQEQLKDSDSYLYLSAINGIASLGTHCTEDVLQILCTEFLQTSTKQSIFETTDNENKIAELRMKIGDIIVKVTKNLGEMAIIHKTLLLNTMLCGCRDTDPLVRASAISNLAEIALVLNYKIGTIIYELLLCLWSIIESDKAVECRRAAVMVITSLLKGLGKENLVQLKENLLPIYRTLKKLYGDPDEDNIVKLHAQLALEELNEAVNQFMFPVLKMEKQIFVLDRPEDILK